jgi:quercetin dioxygenase-like cupin family protein
MAPKLEDKPTRENPCGPIGSEVLFENSQVRIWAMNVPPGERKAWHHHKLPYLIVAMTGGAIEIESVDGSVVQPAEKIGDVIWRDPGEKHELRNLGDTVYRNVLIELKNG